MTSWTPAQLSALELSISRGVTKVTYDGKTVEYRSLSEMLELRDRMRSELGLAQPTGSRLAAFRRGL